MTKEEHQTFSQAEKLHQDPLVMRRSRSLSELPGHLRVPVLRRKDTERTQARLEAGVAGMEELRALREQQQQLVDQTKAAVLNGTTKHKKKRPKHELSDHQRLQLEQSRQQGQGRSISAMSTWHSVSSLGSISEEQDSPAAASVDRKRGASTLPRNMSDWTDQYHHRQQHQHHPQHAHHHANNHHPQERGQHCSSTQEKNSRKRESPKHLDNNQAKAHKNSCESHRSTSANATNHCHRSASEDYGHPIDHENLECFPRKGPSPVQSSLDRTQRHRLIQNQSEERFARGRSQSVHESFTYTPETKQHCHEHSMHRQRSNENFALQTSSHPPEQTKECEATRHLHPSKSESNFLLQHQLHEQTGDCNRSVPIRSFQGSGNYSSHLSTTLSQHRKVQSPLAQSSIRSKSISWDNLLIAIGLQNKNSMSTSNMDSDHSLQEESDDAGDDDDEIFENVSSSQRENHRTSPAESKTKEMPVYKMTRSQSFTCNSLPQPTQRQNGETFTQSTHTGNTVSSKIPDCSATTGIDYMKLPNRNVKISQTPSVTDSKSTSLLRRASLQCEAVLTKSKTPSKIINPLQDVDINSLRSPGPLHAVTLQYSTLPMRNSLENDISMLSTNPDQRRKSLQSKVFVSHAEQSQLKQLRTGSPNLQPILEDGLSSAASTSDASVVKCKSSKNVEGKQQNPEKASVRNEKELDKNVTTTHSKTVPTSHVTLVKTTKSNTRRALFIESAQSAGEDIAGKKRSPVKRDALTKAYDSSVKMFGNEDTNVSPNLFKEVTQKIKSCNASLLKADKTVSEVSDTYSVLPQRHSAVKSEIETKTQIRSGSHDNNKTPPIPRHGHDKNVDNKNIDQSLETRKESEDFQKCEKSVKAGDKIKPNNNRDTSVNSCPPESVTSKANTTFDTSAISGHLHERQTGEVKCALPSVTAPADISKCEKVKSASEETTLESKCDNQCHLSSSQLLSPQTADISILSDDGYSTCDSISHVSRLVLHGYPSSDLSSLSSGSFGSMSFLGDSTSHHSPKHISYMDSLPEKSQSALHTTNLPVLKTAKSQSHNLQTADVSKVMKFPAKQPSSETDLGDKTTGQSKFTKPKENNTGPMVYSKEKTWQINECSTTNDSKEDARNKGKGNSFKEETSQNLHLKHCDSKQQLQTATQNHQEICSESKADTGNGNCSNCDARDDMTKCQHHHVNFAILENGAILQMAKDNDEDVEETTSPTKVNATDFNEVATPGTQTNQAFKQTAV